MDTLEALIPHTKNNHTTPNPHADVEGPALAKQPTPQCFYEQITQRPDIKEILARLAR